MDDQNTMPADENKDENAAAPMEGGEEAAPAAEDTEEKPAEETPAM